MLSKIIALLGAFTLTASTLIAQAPAAANAAPTVNNRYVNKEKRYSIQFPSTWIQRTTDLDGFDVMYQTPPDINNNVYAYMSVVSAKVYPGMALAEFANANTSDLQSLQGFSLEDTSTFYVDNIETRVIIYHYVKDSQAFNAMQAFLIYRDMAYIITGSATADTFSQFFPVFRSVLMSFQYL